MRTFDFRLTPGNDPTADVQIRFTIEIQTRAGTTIHSIGGLHDFRNLLTPAGAPKAVAQFAKHFRTFIEEPMLADLDAHRRKVCAGHDEEIVRYPREIDFIADVRSVKREYFDQQDHREEFSRLLQSRKRSLAV